MGLYTQPPSSGRVDSWCLGLPTGVLPYRSAPAEALGVPNDGTRQRNRHFMHFKLPVARAAIYCNALVAYLLSSAALSLCSLSLLLCGLLHFIAASRSAQRVTSPSGVFSIGVCLPNSEVALDKRHRLLFGSGVQLDCSIFPGGVVKTRWNS